MTSSDSRIDDSLAAEILLSTATEDRHGLYEAIWELNSRFPAASLAEKYRAASAALTSLQSDGLLEFYREDISRRSSAPNSVSEPLAELLANPVSWYPEYRGQRVGFVATEAGRQAYFSRRGAAV